MSWTTVKDSKGKSAGRIRRLSEPFAPEEWEVEGCEGVIFEDSLDALKFILETTEGVQWVVKTELSHHYFAGDCWVDNPNDARRFVREEHAERVAADYTENRGWDHVCVAPWHPTNWS